MATYASRAAIASSKDQEMAKKAGQAATRSARSIDTRSKAPRPPSRQSSKDTQRPGSRAIAPNSSRTRASASTNQSLPRSRSQASQTSGMPKRPLPAKITSDSPRRRLTRADVATKLSSLAAKKPAITEDQEDHDEAKGASLEGASAPMAHDDSTIDMNEDNIQNANTTGRSYTDEDTDMQDAMEELTENLDKSLCLGDDAEHDPEKAQNYQEDEGDELPTVGEFWELEEQVQDLIAAIDKKNQELQELRDRLEERDHKIKRQEDDIRHVTEEMIATRLTSKHRIDDTHLADMWNQLHYKIKQFVADRFGKSRFGTGSSRTVPGKLFDSITAEPTSYWKNPDYKKLLITGWIWNQLIQHVFSQKGQLWAGDANKWVGMMRYTISKWIEESTMTNKEYFEWEATTASAFYRINGIDTARARRLSQRFNSLLYLYETKHNSSENCPTLQNIVEDAARLDAELCRCRAKYVIWMYEPGETGWFAAPNPHRWGWVSDPETMENVLCGGCPVGDEEACYLVDLVVSPCLVKFGDSDGEKYELARVISKRQVMFIKTRRT